MALRVGVDLVSVTAVEAALEDHGDRYLARIYTPAEVAECAGDATRLAARFAAKEATLKVLHAHDIGIAWPSIEVVRTDWGGVSLALTGVAAARAAEEGLASFALSLSHEDGFAVAVVISEEEMPT
jgi:holo-[acyl-carrier protein] synthase